MPLIRVRVPSSAVVHETGGRINQRRGGSSRRPSVADDCARRHDAYLSPGPIADRTRTAYPVITRTAVGGAAPAPGSQQRRRPIARRRNGARRNSIRTRNHRLTDGRGFKPVASLCKIPTRAKQLRKLPNPTPLSFIILKTIFFF